MKKLVLSIVVSILLITSPTSFSQAAEQSRMVVENVNITEASYNNDSTNPTYVTRSNAVRMRVHFSYINLEEWYDYLIINSAEDTMQNPWITGTKYDVWSDWIHGDTIKLYIMADRSETADGFVIDKIEYELAPQYYEYSAPGSSSSIQTASILSPNKTSGELPFNWESVHPLPDSKILTRWFQSLRPAIEIRVHFEYIDMESGYDYLYTSSGNKFTGYHTNVWSNWTNGNRFYIITDTDGSVQSNGWKVDKYQIRLNGGDWLDSTTLYGDSHDFDSNSNAHGGDGHNFVNNGYDWRPTFVSVDSFSRNTDYPKNGTGQYVSPSGETWTVLPDQDIRKNLCI
jgi:hypothetical protein